MQIVSVPESISDDMAIRLKADLTVELGKPILVVTHNTQFLKSERLNPSDTAKVVKRVQVEPARESVMILGADGNPVRDDG